ncbi:Cytoplasmic dynein 1 intermediate chain 2 [Echinococcus granulosus]|uniref:Cytoplasmic dynein 1 intermediate chain 2 n=1 Tax=Echinococcus granulosus TaxID=6210 RepID=W6UCP0_ECHGR|nr:Cytoplasmic dynein 1 intermediate chain 2 [Echinococcus granulosus]EUB56052.1 Cytoplasmic dynein 1 intermediate chain 2 [Echinococcus granulosus]
MSGVDRKVELARKKAKLAALREERLRKEEKHNKALPSSFSIPTVDAISVDGILRELGVVSNIETNGRMDQDELEKSASSVVSTSISDTVERRPQSKLSLSKVFQCSVDSQEPITYSKQVQTDPENLPKVNCKPLSTYHSPLVPAPNIERWNEDASRTFLGLQSFEWDDEIGANPYNENDSHLSEVTQFIRNLELNKSVRFNHPETPVKSAPLRELTEEEKQAAMETESFHEFFSRTSRIIQRALEEPNDIFFDYSGAEREEDAQGKHQLVKYIGDFYDKTYVSGGGRGSVVALDWSAVHPELLLAAYQAQAREGSGVGDGNGVDEGGIECSCCCIWNLKYRQTAPEYVFTYRVDITAATLTEFHPSLVIGGTRGGQIVLWDSRVNRRTPVQMTHLAGDGAAHVEAICGLVVSGSRNANSLVSVSSEGRLCSWALDMLGAPIQTLDLTPSVINSTSSGGVKRSSNPITPTCLAFLPGLDASRFLVCSQDGSVYVGSRHGKNAGLTAQFEGHKAPVTGVSVLASAEVAVIAEDVAVPMTNGGEGPLFVTTGMDCSMRLWSVRESPAYPLLSYEDRNDYFVGCDASPIHPGLFATMDLSGCLDFWSLNSDHEVPTASIQVEGDALLNRCRFHKKGFHLSVGGDDGRVRLFELHESLAMPKADEHIQLNRLVRKLSNSAAEEYEVQNHAWWHGHVR